MNILTNLIARIMYSVPLVMFGIGHFTNADSMASMMIPDLPGAVILIYVTGLALIAAAVAIIFKIKAGLATLLLGIMLLLIAFIVHMPNMMSADEMVSMNGMSNFMKDFGLAGAAFFMSGVFSKEES